MKFRFVQLYDATIYIEGEFTATKTFSSKFTVETLEFQFLLT